MANRTASAPLTGYYYQFDKTILEIMQSADDTSIVVEGLEDIDISAANGVTAVQCKYYAGQSFKESALRKPISLMLTDAASRQQPVDYRLYAYFGGEKAPDTSFTLDRLKALLTYRENGEEVIFYEANTITDEQMRAFLDHFTFEIGPSYEEQHKDVLVALESHFGCSRGEADCHHYNKALRVIFDLAIKPNETDRITTKSGFVDAIDDTSFLFNQWYLRLRSKKEYLKFVRSELNAKRVFHTQGHILAYLPETVCISSTEHPIEHTIVEVARSRFRIGKSLHDAKPWTFVLDVDANRLSQIKRYLLGRAVPFNDGQETIQFTPWLFDRTPFIYRKTTPNGRLTDKIGSASYHLRLVSVSAYTAHSSALKSADIVIDFSGGRWQPKLPNIGTTIIRVAGCDAADVLTLLAP